jgi:hypothetical protein
MVNPAKFRFNIPHLPSIQVTHRTPH